MGSGDKVVDGKVLSKNMSLSATWNKISTTVMRREEQKSLSLNSMKH